MSNNLGLPSPEQYRPEFQDRYENEYQQTTSRAEGLVEKVIVSGEYREFPMLAKTNTVRKITKRFEETAPSTISTGKRRIVTNPFVSPLIFDRVDEKKFGTLESPIGPSIANQRAEAHRNMDATIVGKADEVGGLLGKAIEINEEGVISYPEFDNQFVIPVNYQYKVTGGANTGLTLAKLIRNKTLLGKINVRSQDATTNNPAAFGLLIGYSQIEDLLNDDKIINKDYVFAKLGEIEEGMVTDLFGYSIRAMDDDVLPIDENGIRTCIAFAKNAARFGINDNISHELDRLPTKTHSIQSTCYFDWGMGRVWDEGVWKIPCQEE